MVRNVLYALLTVLLGSCPYGVGEIDPVEMNHTRDTGEKLCLKILGDILFKILAPKQ